MERVDRISMGLSDGFKKKKTNVKFNWYQSDLLASRIFEIQVYFIQITLAQK